MGASIAPFYIGGVYMEVKLFNSMSNKVEVFKPLTDGKVSMYVCGPTVYGYAHVGNMRPVVTFDILRRLFEKVGYQVTYMSNITDIDDKIINAAIKENVTEEVIAKRYEENFFDVCSKLHAKRPTYVPHAIETIPNMIKFIQLLIDEGYAYIQDGDVYFRVNKVKNYGSLSHFQVENLKSGARIEENTKKENPLDFALWKKTDVGIKFPAPFGEGRPGWHTECVVMIQNYYPTARIDIHGGGFDLKFPHHENEIAQANAIFNHSIATYWMHNGFINIDNVKMSKSLGNVLLAKDLVSEYGGNTIRMAMLTSHYRAPLNISEEVLKSSKIEVDKIMQALKQVDVQLQINGISNKEINAELVNKFLEEIANDLNTANGLSIVFQTIKDLNMALRQKKFDEMAVLFNSVLEMLDVLGLEYVSNKLSAEDIDVYQQWNKYRIEKNFEKADELRQELIKRGLI